MTPLYRIREAGLSAGRETIIERLDFDVADRAVSVVLGRTGSGKSTLLRILSGRTGWDGVDVRGRWEYRGAPIDVGERAKPLDGVAWVPQIKHGPSGPFEDERRREWAAQRIAAAFAARADVVLLDEPTRGLTAEEKDALVLRLATQTRTGAAVVVTHDMDFAKRVADHVCVLVEGKVGAAGEAARVFETTTPGPVRDLIQTGAYSLPPYEPPLPSHFRWHVPTQIAGMGQPGLLRDFDEDLFSVACAGISTLINLTQTATPTSRLRPFGICGRHFPITDMGVPSVTEAVQLCRFVLRANERGESVALHCHAGLGRTGTMIAGTLVASGESAARAIQRVREVAPGSIQSPAQERFVMQLEQQVSW